MIRYDLFRALKPDESYPNTPFNLSLNGVKYDMPLPHDVADAFVEQLKRSTEFHCIDKLCTPTGLRNIRTNPTTLDTVKFSFAGCEMYHDIEEPNVTMGYVNQTIAISQPIVEKFLSFVLDGDSFSEEVVMWMYNHVQFLTYCGGFEITRMYFYTDADERDSVQSFIGGISVVHMPESVIESTGRKLRFRDMVNG